jgi:hypothetical protein
MVLVIIIDIYMIKGIIKIKNDIIIMVLDYSIMIKEKKDD